jgi:hypothetical protein
MPKITVCLGSSRPGGLDISFAGLAAQTLDPGEWEVVFTDDRYHTRHAAVLDAARAYGIRAPMYHIPNARYSGDGWAVTSGGFNTGFMLAAGSIVVMLLDWAYPHPGWLEAHVACHEVPGRVGLGSHSRYPLPWGMLKPRKDGKPYRTFKPNGGTDLAALAEQKAAIDEVCAFTSPFDPKWFSELTYLGDAGYALDTKNCSFPLEDVLAVGGMDEHYDSFCGPGDSDLARRFKLRGLEAVHLPAAFLRGIEPRDILPNQRWAVTDYEAVGTQLPSEHGYVYSLRATGAVAPNPYDMAARRAELWHWRELSQEREACIPHNVIPNAEYFR